jgi:hypothetical protein
MLVELPEDGEVVASAPAEPASEPARAAVVDVEPEEQMPASPMTLQDGIRVVQRAFGETAAPLRWPMYVRQAKQFLKNAVEGFDERKYGFASVVDLLRAAGKEGVLRIDRDRQGAIRVFPGPNLAVKLAAPGDDEDDAAIPVERVGEPPIVEAEPIDVQPEGEAVETHAEVEAVAVEAESVTAEPHVTEPKGARKRSRKTSAPKGKSSRPRGRKTTRSKAVAADKTERRAQ